MNNPKRTKLSEKKLVVRRDEAHKISAMVCRRSGVIQIYSGKGIIVDQLHQFDETGDCLTFERNLWSVISMADEKTHFYLEAENKNFFEETGVQEFALAASPKDEYLLVRTGHSVPTSERCFYVRLNGRTLSYLMDLADRAQKLFVAPDRAVSITFGDYYPDMTGAAGDIHSFGYARKGFCGRCARSASRNQSNFGFGAAARI